MHLKIITVVLEQKYLRSQFQGDSVILQIPALTYQSLVDSAIRFIVFGRVRRQLRQAILIQRKLMRVQAEQLQVAETL